MEFVTLPTGLEDRFGTRGVQLWAVADLTTTDVARTQAARFHPDSVLGKHPTKLWQLFTVVEGSGRVSGEDDERRPISVGQAAFWRPTEVHASGSEHGLLAAMVASTSALTLPTEKA